MRSVCFVMIFISFGLVEARQQISEESDTWCSKGTCSSTPQSDNIQINIPDGGNVPPGSWVNNQIQISPSGGDGDGEFTFSSNDESICTVDNDGNVTRVSIGSCSINVIKGADLEYAQKTFQTSFNITCDEQPALTLVSNGNWSNQDTRQIHIAGGGNGHVTWMTSDSDICSISNNGLLTQHATGSCNVTAIQDADNENFTCGAQGSINFSTAVYSSLNIVNGNCSAGWVKPKKDDFLAAYQKNLQSWRSRSVYYYRVSGKKVWLRLADGHYYFTHSGTMTKHAHYKPLSQAINWTWKTNNNPSGYGGTLKSICLK